MAKAFDAGMFSLTVKGLLVAKSFKLSLLYFLNSLLKSPSVNINKNKKKIFIPSLGDHRICMSAFILAVLTGIKTKIINFETVFTSSPSFLKIMKTLGAKFEIQ